MRRPTGSTRTRRRSTRACCRARSTRPSSTPRSCSPRRSPPTARSRSSGQYKTGEKYGAIYPKGSANEDAFNQGIQTMLDDGTLDQPVEDLPRARLRWRPAVGAGLADPVMRGMSTSSLVSEELQPSPPPSRPAWRGWPRRRGAGAVRPSATLAMAYAGKLLRDYNHNGAALDDRGCHAWCSSAADPWVPRVLSFARASDGARSLLRDDELVGGPAHGCRGPRAGADRHGVRRRRAWSWPGLLIFVLANDGGVASDLLRSGPHRSSRSTR